MKRLPFKSIVIGFLSLIYFGAYAQTNLEMRTLVAQMNTDMIEMAKANRFEAMSKYYDKEAISLPNYRAMEKGYALILNNNQGRQKGGYKIIDGKKTTSDLIMGIDMMVDIGTYSLTVTFPGVSEPKTDMGKYMNVWKKDKEDNWRIVAETWNADKSPCGPPAPKQGQPSGTNSSTIRTNPGTQQGAQPGTAPKPATGEGKK